MISLDKCNESFNVFSPKIVFRKKAKGINIQVVNLIINQNEAKTLTKHISYAFKYKFNSTTCNSN